ncbi:uncharacterized protein LOC116929025 [Daphnia magna]|uniref:uncharacterized protein LOC116929025 n=1 Tax=Daphnia magna TaxID=35525 RepID=UPI001E1BC4C3|nr:uncharacterized protein LOC116929025 [Daphnia magna]
MNKVIFIFALMVAVAVALPQRPFRPRPGGFQQPGFGGFNNFGGSGTGAGAGTGKCWPWRCICIWSRYLKCSKWRIRYWLGYWIGIYWSLWSGRCHWPGYWKQFWEIS